MPPVWFLALSAAAGVYLAVGSLVPNVPLLGVLQKERFAAPKPLGVVGSSVGLAGLYFFVGMIVGGLWSGFFPVGVVFGALVGGIPLAVGHLREMRGAKADGELLRDLTQELVRLLDAEPTMHLADGLSVAYNIIHQRTCMAGSGGRNQSLVLAGLGSAVSATNSGRAELKATLPEALRKKRPDLVLLVHCLQAGLDQGFDVRPTLRRLGTFLALRQQQSLRARGQYVPAKKLAGGIILLDACILGLGRFGWVSAWNWYGQGGNLVWLIVAVLWLGAVFYGSLFFDAATGEG